MTGFAINRRLFYSLNARPQARAAPGASSCKALFGDMRIEYALRVADLQHALYSRDRHSWASFSATSICAGDIRPLSCTHRVGAHVGKATGMGL